MSQTMETYRCNPSVLKRVYGAIADRGRRERLIGLTTKYKIITRAAGRLLVGT